MQRKRDSGINVGAALVVVIYICLQEFPQTWWLLAFAFVVLVSVVLSNLRRCLILPLFFKTRPLDDPRAPQEALGLADAPKLRSGMSSSINFSQQDYRWKRYADGLG